jgi:hypothetical protein
VVSGCGDHADASKMHEIAQQWYLPAELFDEYFMPQIELRIMLEFDKAAVVYNADRRCWNLSSFIDEHNERT